MAKVFYVSQEVHDANRGRGVLNFRTEDEQKARREAALHPDVRFLFVFEDGQLIEDCRAASEFVRANVKRKEAQAHALELRAAGS